MPGSSARTRLASKQQECSTRCNMSKGENWILCERFQRWTHNTCMGYSKDEFKFLERANVTFTCNCCPQSPPIDAIDTNEIEQGYHGAQGECGKYSDYGGGNSLK